MARTIAGMPNPNQQLHNNQLGIVPDGVDHQHDRGDDRGENRTRFTSRSRGID
jgi:hypothetical protein